MALVVALCARVGRLFDGAPCGGADLAKSTVRCFVFGDAAHALSQVRAGALVAVLRCRGDDPDGGGGGGGGGGSCVKVLDAAQVHVIGTSVDMGTCAGRTRAGAPCGAVVNKRLGQSFCDVHLAQAKQAVAMRARAECKGTLLVTAYESTARRAAAGRGGGAARGPSWQDKIASDAAARRCRTTTRARPAHRTLQAARWLLMRARDRAQQA